MDLKFLRVGSVPFLTFVNNDFSIRCRDTATAGFVAVQYRLVSGGGAMRTLRAGTIVDMACL